MEKLKRYFISGLVFIIPISLSIWILYKVIIFLDGILGNLLKKFFPNIYTPGIGFFSIILIILFVGFLTQNFIGKKLLRRIEVIFEKVPVLNRIYNFIKSIVQSVTTKKEQIFKGVAKIKFFDGSYTIGFITGESQLIKEEKFLSIFVPTVPNITTGFYILVPEKRVEKLNISVEEGFKIMISAGFAENATNKE